jgi:hypothetical protein
MADKWFQIKDTPSQTLETRRPCIAVAIDEFEIDLQQSSANLHKCLVGM